MVTVLAGSRAALAGTEPAGAKQKYVDNLEGDDEIFPAARAERTAPGILP